MAPPDPLAHVPDPSDRYQVFGYLDADGMPWVEVADAETREGMRLDLISALKVSGDISRQAAYVIEQVVARFADDESRAPDERWYRSLWRHSPD